VNDTFVLGDTNAICDECGFKFKGSMLRKRWDGAMVCSKDWETRHPQDSIKVRPEQNNVRDPRPEPEPRYLAVGEITAADL
jgi:hypothetical protein